MKAESLCQLVLTVSHRVPKDSGCWRGIISAVVWVRVECRVSLWFVIEH